ncbi:TetR/AcrR family transcriptional regulator [Mycobacterium sp.]|uniref:TetR/AcrR family transcriptional regulator n=1 Tax=Mycobacterium sp. TaxID=1785 RepID=UPI000CB2D564|nr:TetR/AcrR family transcriptional regulator [Mycobacterium sp.]PJE01763.1 MAG: TetR family transcriptional regulator [Mycobacterium sp.]
MPPPTSSAGLRRREEILGIATKLFAARGYHGTRMDDLADAVGINKATLYHYYSSKSLLLYGIYQLAASATMSAVQPEPNCSPRDALEQCTTNLLRVMAVEPAGTAVYFQESPYIAEWLTDDQVADIRTAEAFVYNQIRDIVDRGIAVGEFRDCDSHMFALGYIGMTLGSHRWLTPTSPESADCIAGEINRVLLRGLSRALSRTGVRT